MPKPKAPMRFRSGHGGKRPGAGRKPKVRAATVLDAADVRLLIDDAAPAQIENVAQQHARQAIGALVKKLLAGGNEAARVRSANLILDRGYAKPAVEAPGSDLFGLTPVSSPAGTAEMQAEARKHARLAVEVLRRIAEFGQSESASVSAASSLLDRGFGTVGLAKVPDDIVRTLGKREQIEADAKAALTGIFAPPAPPSSDNSETTH